MAFNPTASSGEDNLRSALSKAELQALDALKLQYFQNATRCLAKGDYDNALAEIKRVLLIDPEHHLAREYEVRVNQLKAARAQSPKPSPVPLKQAPKSPPPPAEATVQAKPAKSRKPLFYLALAVCVLVGTAGIVTLEKGNDAKQPPPPPAAVAEQTPAAEASTPVEEPVQRAYTEPTPLPTVPVTSAGTKGAAAEKSRTVHEEDLESASPSHSAPVRLASATPPEPAAARRSEPARSEKASPVVEKASEKVVNKSPEKLADKAAEAKADKILEKSAPSLPTPEKKELPAPMAEVKLAAAEPRAAEPPRESKPFVAVEKQPQIVRLEKVRLPEIVARNHMSGEVTAKVLVSAEGKPQEVQIVSSTSSIFEQPVIDALSQSTFSPGMMGTGPVAAWVVIPFKFK